MISASLSPNTEFDDVLLALKVLCMPWKWQRGWAVGQVERRLHGVSFNSGRSALLAILKAFEIGKGDEVLVQAFTCVAVPNSVHWSGATPIYIDINDSYNMDISQIEKKITPRTKAIIVQHTFGIPADIAAIVAIAKKYKVKVIEDFAHTMNLQMSGDAAFYSFGRDKVLSSVFGGLAVMKDNSKIKKFHKTLEYPSLFWIVQQLFHPIAFSIILPLYRLGIGKVLLVVFQRLHLLSFPQISEVKKYPNALAFLLLNQLKKLERYTKQREEIVKMYGGQGSLLRFPLQVEDPKKMIAKAKKEGILLGNWYHNVIDPAPVSYTPGSCPKAEKVAQHIINVPTLITKASAQRVWKLLS